MKLVLVFLLVFCGHVRYVASSTTVMLGPTFDNLNDLKTRLNEEKRMIQHVIAFIVSIFDCILDLLVWLIILLGFLLSKKHPCQILSDLWLIASWSFFASCKVNPEKLHVLNTLTTIKIAP